MKCVLLGKVVCLLRILDTEKSELNFSSIWHIQKEDVII